MNTLTTSPVAPLLDRLFTGQLAGGLNTFAEFYARVAARNLHQTAGYCVARFVFGHVLVQTDRNQLLDAQPHLPLRRIDFEHLRPDHLPQLEHILRMVDVFFATDLADEGSGRCAAAGRRAGGLREQRALGHGTPRDGRRHPRA